MTEEFRPNPNRHDALVGSNTAQTLLNTRQAVSLLLALDFENLVEGAEMGVFHHL